MGIPWQRAKEGNFPQVVCISTGVDCHWNWLDEKELAELESRMNWAWLYHEYYLDKDENRPVGSILEKSDAAIVTIQLTPGESSGRMLRNIHDYVQQPFRHLSVLQVRNENHLHSLIPTSKGPWNIIVPSLMSPFLTGKKPTSESS